ncbi:MAG: hypothetical protein KME46_21630 [Brasilonema angustatum HA4187-MV1]|nr:hypothetical protein [Brasilonema angustatum HA4187-MV1]
MAESVNSINTRNTQKFRSKLNLLQKGEVEAADRCFYFSSLTMIIILAVGDFIAWKFLGLRLSGYLQ